MILNQEQQELLDGKKGAAMAKVVKTLKMYGDCFDAEKMVPVTGDHGHLVTSFGLSVLKPVYEIMDELIAEGVLAKQSFSVDPRPTEKNVPANFLQNVFFKVMYSKQNMYEQQLSKLGLMDESAFTCTCYETEVGNQPRFGDVLSWAESSAVVYANSVLGARCNRNSGIIELFGSIAGFVPYFGLLTDEGRKADWIIEVDTTSKPEAQVLGSAIGMKVLEDVPYIKGLDKWLGTELNDAVCDYLKDMGAATASNGAVGLYHVENLTPEAKAQREELVKEGAAVYRIDDAKLARIQANYPVIWKDSAAEPKMCFIGCPHLSSLQLKEWTNSICDMLKQHGQKKVAIPTVFTASPKVAEKFRKTSEYQSLANAGIVLSSICPLMYMNNPLCGKMPVITNSNKLRTYTTARYYRDEEILEKLTKGGV